MIVINNGSGIIIHIGIGYIPSNFISITFIVTSIVIVINIMVVIILFRCVIMINLSHKFTKTKDKVATKTNPANPKVLKPENLLLVLIAGYARRKKINARNTQRHKDPHLMLYRSVRADILVVCMQEYDSMTAARMPKHRLWVSPIHRDVSRRYADTPSPELNKYQSVRCVNYFDLL